MLEEPTDILTLIKVTDKAIQKALDSDIQLVMKQLGVPFESYYNLFEIIGINIKTINHENNLNRLIQHSGIKNQNLLVMVDSQER